ncbi:aldehyde dehydrogenase family protein [bacterium AH-315-I18]|nr:aldehyde dehydrogenase family protein [bacterium AH-315-I18]
MELIEQAGFPDGVVNLVHGDKIAAQALLEHNDVDGISFVGSSTIARHVAKTCADHGKRYQALGSAKNYLVVMPDAPREKVVANMLTSSLGCAGQRCMAASVIACVGDETYDEIVERFVTAAKKAVVGDPLDPALANEGLVIGPVISAAAKQRIEQLIDQGVAEGEKLLVDGRNHQVQGKSGGHYVGPTIFVDVKPGSTLEQTEIFGPVVIIMKFDSLDDAIAAINNHPFGNGASIYTQSGHHARRFKLEAQAGMIGINVGIPAPVAYLPFGGMKKSIYADIKAQGRAGVNFFTESKIVTQRYWPSL